MRDGCYIVGGGDERRDDLGPPASCPERRIANRFIELGDPTASHRHAELIVYHGRVRLIDLGSARGTHLVRPEGRQRIFEAEVAPDMTVEFGRCRRQVRDLIEAANRCFADSMA
ncbi:MAG: FHA domain-containing protein [Halofilum sp. (in: g-proteobacteria)]|nr:FHA domain-containing protein [Halofilum sp. (in: g-proteobacteria)]